MSPDKQRISIAEFCGWTPWKTVSPIDRATPITLFEDGSGKVITELPDYITDLNAMHEAEKMLLHSGFTDTLGLNYWNALWRVCGDEYGKLTSIATATAAQRAEALLRTIGKWEE